MKLTDLGAWPASKAATAKLANQTSAVYVPAGKAPYTDLSIVGVKMRHKQSTGLTSRVRVVESIGADDAWQMFDHLEHELGNTMLRPDRFGKEAPFNRDIAMNIALQLIRSYKIKPDGSFDRATLRFAIDAEHALSKLRLLYGSLNNEVGQFLEWFDKLGELGLDMPEELKQQHQAIVDLDSNRAEWESTLQMVAHITSYVDNLISLYKAEKTSDYHRSIIRACLKQLGVFE